MNTSDTPSANYDVIVVGAGISGLAAAYALHQRGARVLVLEARAAPGGSIRSEQSDGFVVENGPNTVVSRDALLWQHFTELGIEQDRVTADRSSGKRYIVLHGKPTLIPTSPPALVQSNLLSLRAKLRMLAEPLLPRAVTPDESVAAFFARRLGSEPMQQLVDPFVAGIYAGDPYELSAKATFPTLWEAEQQHGSILVGMVAKAFASKPARTAQGDTPKREKSVMFSFREGLVTWPRAMARAIGVERVWYNAPVQRIYPTAQGWDVTVLRDEQPHTVGAAQVVLAAPAHVLADLIAPVDRAAQVALAEMPGYPLSMVHLGYRRETVQDPLDGFGMLCPAREGRGVLGILYPSSLFPGRAPEGMVLTTTFAGGARLPTLAELDDEQLIELVRREHAELLGATGAPVFARVARWARAIPQYVGGHEARLAVLRESEERYPGLHYLGNYRDGVSVEKCWHKGIELGQRLPLRHSTAHAALAQG